MPLVSYTAGQAAEQMTRLFMGWRVDFADGAAVSYAFRSSAGSTDNVAGHNEEVSFQRFTGAQIQAAREILELYADVCGIRFVERNNPSLNGFSNEASILLANYRDTFDVESGFTPYPPDGGRLDGAHDSPQGDVWINLFRRDANDAGRGSATYQTLMHELGHAVGLMHPGDYNAGDGKTYADALYREDTQQYSVMSYWSETYTGADYKGFRPQTPLLHDIAALQLERNYGVNDDTRKGNTVYGSGSNADREVFDFDINRTPVLTIWDAGGYDTLSIATHTSAPGAVWNGQVLDLRQGAFSSIYAFVGDKGWELRNNVSIAYGTVIESAIGGPGRETIWGNEADNFLSGLDGDDELHGLGGRDILDGGEGGDALEGDEGNDWLRGGDGRDYLFGGTGDDLLQGEGDHDTLLGGEGNDTLDGGDWGDDSLNGMDGDDVLDGGRYGEDTLVGGRGRDTILGRQGNDAIWGDLGTGSPGSADSIDGGEGDDTIRGEAGNDVLEGRDGADVLDGGSGADLMRGGLGDDVYVVDDAGDVVSERISSGMGKFASGYDAGSIDTVRAQLASYTLPPSFESGLENLIYDLDGGNFAGTGNNLANVVQGGSGADTLRGEGGDDELQGLGGADVLVGGPGADRLVGGFGNDLYDAVDAQDTIEENGFGGIDTVRTAERTYFLPDWVDNLTMTAARGNITGHGNDLDNRINAALGSTTASGARFELFGHGGNDLIAGSNNVRGDALHGGDGNDTLEGGGGNDTLIGGPGADRLDGGGLTDTADYSGAAGGVVLSLASGGSGGEAAGDSFVAVEYVTGSPFDDGLTGDGAANRLLGAAGNDSLDGAGGNDTLDGGEGRNDLRGGAGNDSLVGGTLFDTFDGGDGNDTLRGSGGQTAMLGGAGNDVLIGSLTNTNAMEAGPGDDSLSGGAFGDSMQDTQGGNDTMRGGGGNDTLVDYAGINQLFGEGGDDFVVSGSNIGSLLDGGDGDDFLFSAFGNNTLLGGAGNDRLENQEGGAVPNRFSGGSGADVFVYRVGVSVEANVRVLDFEDGVDRIGLRFDRFEDLRIADGPDGAVISLPGGASPMTLVGIPASLLGVEDFVSV